jgi:nitrite reductase/ring-hydroxylating ferredoxin subunit
MPANPVIISQAVLSQLTANTKTSHSTQPVSDSAQVIALGFEVGEKPWPLKGIAVCVNERWVAYENRCPHAKHALDLPPGRFLSDDARYLQCRSHGALFELHTGECVAGPCVGQALTRLNVAVNNAQLELIVADMP